jgi:protein-S-isoprenylcysteine O-methyltransferase Ste14
MQVIEATKIDYKKYVGSLIMFSFAVLSILRWNRSGELFFLLLSFRDLVASYFLATREKAEVNSGNTMAILAYVSSGLPLLYFSAPFGIELRSHRLVFDLLTIVGFLIVTWATIDLGTKIGVSPAKRGEKVVKGIYRFVSHPMYLGYCIAQLGWVLVNKWNLYIYLTALLLFALRARSESKMFNLKIKCK